MNKQDLEYLRKNDPISYYELTSNPTGADGSDNPELGCALVFVGLVLLCSILLWVVG